MFKIPAATLEFWNRLDIAPATEAEIGEIAAMAPGPLPDDYTNFLSRFGFVRWMLTVPDRFEYHKVSEAQTVSKTGSVAHLEKPDSIRRAMDHAWSNDPDLGLPCWPVGVMPLAGNAGPGQVLLDFREAPHATVRYWEPAQDPWGQGDNMALCTVADSFTAFINGLHLRE